MSVLKIAPETRHRAAPGSAPRHPAQAASAGSPERLRELLLEALALFDAKRGGTVRRTNRDDDDEDPTRRAGGRPP